MCVLYNFLSFVLFLGFLLLTYVKDSILGMLNVLIRDYINFRFRWTNDDWKIRFEVYFLHDLS